MSKTPSYRALIELISRLEGKDKKTCELALYCLNKADRREKRLRAENDKLAALSSKASQMRIALEPFIKWVDEYHRWDDKTKVNFIIKVGDIRAAAAAYKEAPNE